VILQRQLARLNLEVDHGEVTNNKSQIQIQNNNLSESTFSEDQFFDVDDRVTSTTVSLIDSYMFHSTLNVTSKTDEVIGHSSLRINFRKSKIFFAESADDLSVSIDLYDKSSKITRIPRCLVVELDNTVCSGSLAEKDYKLTLDLSVKDMRIFESGSSCKHQSLFCLVLSFQPTMDPRSIISPPCIESSFTSDVSDSNGDKSNDSSSSGIATSKLQPILFSMNVSSVIYWNNIFNSLLSTSSNYESDSCYQFTLDCPQIQLFLATDSSYDNKLFDGFIFPLDANDTFSSWERIKNDEFVKHLSCGEGGLSVRFSNILASNSFKSRLNKNEAKLIEVQNIVFYTFLWSPKLNCHIWKALAHVNGDITNGIPISVVQMPKRGQMRNDRDLLVNRNSYDFLELKASATIIGLSLVFIYILKKMHFS
jgi:hypothetical protein